MSPRSFAAQALRCSRRRWKTATSCGRFVAPGAAEQIAQLFRKTVRRGSHSAWRRRVPGPRGAGQGAPREVSADDKRGRVITATAQSQATRSSSSRKHAEDGRPVDGLRAHLGRELDMIEADAYRFCWITDFPFYERDPETGQITFSHNPFSMPQGGLEALNTRDPLSIKAYQYDIVCNGVELSSGAIRNHRPDIMLRAFEIAGYGPEEVESASEAC